MTDRPVPLLGDLSLDAVQEIAHELDGGFVATRVAGLDGEVQQRTGRPSHRVVLSGELVGDGTADALAALQKAAASGDEVTFAADITTALELQQVVVVALRAAAVAGTGPRYRYELWLAESPPLPSPAELEGFGGLDDFGLGDLGFDDLGGVLGDITDLAGSVADAVDKAVDAVQAVQSLAALADLGVPDASGLFAPLATPVKAVGDAAGRLVRAAGDLGAAFGGGA